MASLKVVSQCFHLVSRNSCQWAVLHLVSAIPGCQCQGVTEAVEEEVVRIGSRDVLFEKCMILLAHVEIPVAL